MATASSLGIFFTRIGASIRFCSTDMCGHRLKCWNTMPMSERTARPAALTCLFGAGVEMGTPCITTRPSLGSSSRARQRSSVVFPEPDGPTTHTTSRSETSSETRVSTWLAPKRLVMPSARIRGAVLLMSLHKQFLCRSIGDCRIGRGFARRVGRNCQNDQ